MTAPGAPVLRRAMDHLRSVDPVMARAIERVGRCRLDEVQRSLPFPALLEAIIYQQLSMRAAATIHGRFLDLFARRRPSASRLLALGDEPLRRAGLSRQKIGYLRDLAARVRTGSLSLGRLAGLADEQVVEELMRVRGIGRWTAHMFLIFRLGRLDVLPVDDLGVLEATRLLYGLRERPNAARLERIADSWRPYRSVACWYLWQSRRTGGLQPEATGR